MRVAVVTDSNSGITQREAKELGIRVIPMPFMIDGETYEEDINFTQEQFYRRQEEDADISTSQPSPETVMGIWDELLKEYDEIVHIPMSSALSGSCQTAVMLAMDYDGKVQVVNNQRISVTQRRSALDAMEMAAAGYPAAKIKEILEETKLDSSIYLVVDTLKYLKKGGRITPAAAALGTLLKIKPVLQIQGGKLDAFAKVRTVKQGKSTMMSAMAHDLDQRFGDKNCENMWLYVVHSCNGAAAQEMVEELQQVYPSAVIETADLSLSVACHTGPGVLAIACVKKMDLKV